MWLARRACKGRSQAGLDRGLSLKACLEAKGVAQIYPKEEGTSAYKLAGVLEFQEFAADLECDDYES